MNHNLLKIKEILGTGLIMFLLFVPTFSSSAKEIPPYPDIWGYDLSTISDGVGVKAAHKMKDGDILFVLAINDWKRDPKTGQNDLILRKKCILLKFFSGEKTELDPKVCYKKMDKRNVFGVRAELDSSFSSIHFSDGSSLKFGSETGGRLCSHLEIAREYLLKTTKGGEEKKYSIISLWPGNEVSMWTDEGMCEFSNNEAPILYQKLRFLGYNLIKLQDDTFIIYGSRLILRFDKNINTKFVPLTPIKFNGYAMSRNFFVLDFEKMMAVGRKDRGSRSYYQTIHDNLLRHLIDNYQLKQNQEMSDESREEL